MSDASCTFRKLELLTSPALSIRVCRCLGPNRACLGPEDAGEVCLHCKQCSDQREPVYPLARACSDARQHDDTYLWVVGSVVLSADEQASRRCISSVHQAGDGPLTCE